MIIFKKSDSSLNIPVGLGVSIGPLDASLVPLEVDSSTVAQSITPSGDGFSSVTVNPYTLDSKTVDSSTVSQIITSDEDGLSSVTVNPVNASIDSDIQPGNIREGVEILGVEGTFQGGTLQAKTADSSLLIQTITPDAGNYGLSSVVVNPYTTERLTLDVSQNGIYTLIPQSANALSGAEIRVDIQSDFNWIIEARKGTLSDLSGYSLPAPVRSYQYSSLLENTNMTDMPALETGNGVLDEDYAFSYAFQNTPLRNVEIGFTEINGNGAFRGAFSSCTSLTSVSFPELICIRGYASFQYAFEYCRSLTSVSFPKLRDVTTSIGSTNWFPTDSGVVNFTVHPDALQTDRPAYNIIYSAKNVTNLTLTAPVTNSLYVPWQSRLSAESVKGILEKIDLTVSDKQVDFYNGLTVTDDTQGSIQTAYDAAVAAGWTINNLTIVPATGLIVLTSPSTISMDISGDTAQITFDAYDTWGAEATIGGGTFPDFSVSPAYGSSGSQTITVTKSFSPILHPDDGIITISSGSYSVDVTVSFT